MENKKKYKLETVNCPLCSSKNYKVYIKKAKELYNGMEEYFDVCECKSCSHKWTNPRPTKDTIRYFYPNNAGYYQPIKYSKKQGLQYEIYKKILNMFFGYKLNSSIPGFLALIAYIIKKQDIAVTHIPRFLDNGKVLDIGCSYGLYLKKLQNYGWDVYGTELNQKAVSYANNVLELHNVKYGFFEDIKYKDSYFDVVNMNMVLEHIHEPVNTIKSVNNILKKEGQFILSVPDISGFESMKYKQYSYALQVPTHLHHFTPKTITNLLESNGFKVEQIIHQKTDRDLVASAGYMPNQTLAKFLHNKIIRKSFVKIFINILVLLGKTSRMSIYARKI